MTDEEESAPITIGITGIPLDDDEPEVVVDEEALLAAMYRLERRQSRALKKLQQKVKRAHRRKVNESRRRNRK